MVSENNRIIYVYLLQLDYFLTDHLILYLLIFFLLVESALQDRYAAIDNLGDRAFQVLLDLCMVNDSSSSSGGSACQKPAQDL